ncbi:RagB/SusD family nutrient uptake outer membrane protein [Flavivirga sp. 57AJ16]|uniref:RagB/SusD family nutrient uptake outer membrane protein n=1 Tax=Flavivirga sp. 57AJ16 TaxID=3025307 RepID=UPI002365B68D|nr:RagB/SusD family nutrient uptake outer membrane protein [Flavivirga sp. 57AJ16]MDD7885091.1 RagB/SusD family nutrient uptake outer membrane protein [Flavivirga sp. 57AJ16]
MIRKYNHIILLCIFSLSLGSCEDYLDLQPEDKYTEDQVFSNELAIQEVLNGLYNKLASNSLYGANLSTTTVELLAQRYHTARIGSVTAYSSLQGYNYNSNMVQPIFDDIWVSAYATISETNKFISELDEARQNSVISVEKANLLKGEAVAIRALLHFDLLRLFGPVYQTDSDKEAIPYYTDTDTQTQPILSAEMVVNKIAADLEAAQELMANDPVKGVGVVFSQDFYKGYRNQRLNFYAIKALRARVSLYAGNTMLAHSLAKETLDEGENQFPWLDFSNIVSGTDNPDRIFSTEVLFGVYNSNMYTNYTNFFSPELLENSLLAPHPERLEQVFENNENDYRYTTTWLNSIKGFRLFYKFADIVDQTKPWRFVQPLIRKSEMYYILAETETDPDAALSYLNTVRNNRGLGDLPSGSDLNSEIRKEYQKEFWGEGQLFFYYKRKNIFDVPEATNGYPWWTIAPSYVVPLPLSETTPR